MSVKLNLSSMVTPDLARLSTGRQHPESGENKDKCKLHLHPKIICTISSLVTNVFPGNWGKLKYVGTYSPEPSPRERAIVVKFFRFQQQRNLGLVSGDEMIVPVVVYGQTTNSRKFTKNRPPFLHPEIVERWLVERVACLTPPGRRETRGELQSAYHRMWCNW